MNIIIALPCTLSAAKRWNFVNQLREVDAVVAATLIDGATQQWGRENPEVWVELSDVQQAEAVHEIPIFATIALLLRTVGAQEASIELPGKRIIIVSARQGNTDIPRPTAVSR